MKNFEAGQPYHHADYYLAVLLVEQCWTRNELLDAMACKYVRANLSKKNAIES